MRQEGQTTTVSLIRPQRDPFLRDSSLGADEQEILCPKCGISMSLIRERTEVTIDGMRHSLRDFWCSQHGLWHYDVDTEELSQREKSDLEEL